MANKVKQCSIIFSKASIAMTVNIRFTIDAALGEKVDWLIKCKYHIHT